MLAAQGAPSCWFSELELADGHVTESGHQHSRAASPLPTLLELERTIQSRCEAAEAAKGGGGHQLSVIFCFNSIIHRHSAPTWLHERSMGGCMW